MIATVGRLPPADKPHFHRASFVLIHPLSPVGHVSLQELRQSHQACTQSGMQTSFEVPVILVVIRQDADVLARANYLWGGLLYLRLLKGCRKVCMW